jgi:hypothetical protein
MARIPESTINSRHTDVDGLIVVLDGVYYPDTTLSVVDGDRGTMPSVVDE